MEQVHLIITGHVQGVGYRRFVMSHAQRFGLTGWVQNLPDGSVEIVAQGPRGTLEAFVQQCKRGPSLARVKGVDITWEEIKKKFPDFHIYSREVTS